MKRAVIAALSLWLALSAQTLPTAAPVPAEESHGRIVGGHTARYAPWQAEIYRSTPFTREELAEEAAYPDTDPHKLYWDRKPDWENKHRCGGALIAPDWVLTAGHCVQPILGEGGIFAQRRVRIGSQSLLPGASGASYQIDRVVLHKDFDYDKLVNDIALIHIVADAQTAKPSGTAKVIPMIGPQDRPVAADDAVSATGWGGTLAKKVGGREAFAADNTSLERMSPALQELDLTIRESAFCQAQSGAYLAALQTGRALCVAAQAGQGDCNGDSGGPLVRAEGGNKFVLVGLVSQGRGCAMGKPSLFTKVSEFRDWIDDAKRASVALEMVRR